MQVFLGGWGNSKSVIRKNRAKPDVAEAETPGILSGDESRGFWIRLVIAINYRTKATVSQLISKSMPYFF